jgi:hypothetical protein
MVTEAPLEAGSPAEAEEPKANAASPKAPSATKKSPAKAASSHKAVAVPKPEAGDRAQAAGMDSEDSQDAGTSERTQAPKATSPAKAASRHLEPKPPKETKEAKEAREAKRVATEELEQSKERWHELKNRLGTSNMTDYSLGGDYGLDQTLRHSKFGVGYVVKVVPPNKVEVQFEESVKTLMMRVGQGK